MRLRPTGTLKNISSIIIYCIIFSTLVWVPIVSIKHNHVTHETPQAPLPTVPVETVPVASEVFTLVNTERSKVGLAPLVEDTRLDTAAAAKCADMASRNYWSHDTPDGVEPWQFILNAGVSYLAAGENLEYGSTTSSVVVTGWMGSPGHRENILRTNFTNVGTAVCFAQNYTSAKDILIRNGYIVIQEFAQE